MLFLSHRGRPCGHFFGVLMPTSWKRALLGRPLATAAEKHERLGKISGLAVFASDALSSVAYGTEEIMLVLVAAGTVAIAYSFPIMMGIVILVGIVAASYWQTIHAYPSGGGSYIVAKDNLGDTARSHRGGGPAPRLHSHRGGEHRGRGGRRHLSLPGAVPMARRDLRRHRDGRNRRQSSGGARVGKPLHHSHLLVHRKPGCPPGGRRVPNRDRNGPALSGRRTEIDGRHRRLPAPARLLLGVRDAHRHRSGEQRHPGVSTARAQKREHHARVDGLHPGRDIPRDRLPGPPVPCHAERGRDRRLHAGPSDHGRGHPLLQHPGGHGRHSLLGREHILPGLSPAFLDIGPGRLHAAADGQPRRSSRLQ